MLDVQVEGSYRKSAGSARLLFLFSDVELNPTDTAARGSSLTGRLVEAARRGAEAEAETEAEAEAEEFTGNLHFSARSDWSSSIKVLA